MGIKKKRKGGARDESEVNIDFSRIELLESIIVKDKEFGVHFNHSFSYRFKCHKSQPILWRGIKKGNQKIYRRMAAEAAFYLIGYG